MNKKKTSDFRKSIIWLVLIAAMSSVSVRGFSRAGAASLSSVLGTNAAAARGAIPAAVTSRLPRITLLFTGDMNLGRCVARQSILARNYAYPFQFVADRLRAADITIGSLDGALSDQAAPMDCPQSMNLIGPADMVQGLQFAGFDVITVATNHSKDCGDLGFRCNDRAFIETLANLRNASIFPVGGGSYLAAARAPIVIERSGVRFAFLAVDQVDPRVWATDDRAGVAPLSASTIEQVKADIAAAKQVADVVIVLPQWGTEYAASPDKVERAWANAFIDAGATLVIGNGPHIVQPAETAGSGLIAYALGNFVFDQGQDFRREGVAAQVVFEGSQLESWQLLPVYINYFTYQPSWAEGAQADWILQRATPASP